MCTCPASKAVEARAAMREVDKGFRELAVLIAFHTTTWWPLESPWRSPVRRNANEPNPEREDCISPGRTRHHQRCPL